MQKYVSIGRAMPAKRAAEERIADHREIYADFTADEAARQASRCEQCGVPYCQIHCPLHNNIPDWLKLTAEGRLDEAYARAQETNNFPEICGRICPQDRLCEAKWACTLEQAGHGTVTIGAVERYITDNAWEQGWVKPRRPRQERSERIAIIGAGPAGMAAAEELRAGGFQVHLYDRHQRMGGLMTYGIPEFKLEQRIVARRAALLLEAGVRFHPGATLGRELSLPALRHAHDAVVLAFGAYRARPLGVPGTDLGCVTPALDYLIDSSRRQIGEAVTGADAAGRRVVVIGGGDTAMDCVRTAVRQGARSVVCLYRRDRQNMPGSAREVGHAEEEGVDFHWQAQPEALSDVPVEVIAGDPIEVTRHGSVAAIRAIRTRLTRANGNGRSEAEPIPGTAFELPAELVVNALGFMVEDAGALTGGSVGMTSRGTVAAGSESRMTDADGVFVAGDAWRGPSLVVWAIRDGRDVALEVKRYLEAGARGEAAERPGRRPSAAPPGGADRAVEAALLAGGAK